MQTSKKFKLYKLAHIYKVKITSFQDNTRAQKQIVGGDKIDFKAI